MKISCVCGYIHESGFDERGDWSPFLQGKKEFYKIDGTFILDDNRYETTKVSLMVCPECFTVKAEKNY